MPLPSASSPENQLLVLIARRSIDQETAKEIRALVSRADLDWNYLSTAAVTHGVAALFAHHVQSVAAELVPAHTLVELQLRNRHYFESYLILTSELAKIVAMLKDNGIVCLAFKGPTLGLMAYGDPALRQFADLDILVHKRDLPRAKETLSQQGFRPFSVLDRGREAALLRFDNAYPFTNDAEVIVDVHWRFAALYSSLLVDTDEFWKRAEPLQIGDRTVMTLSAEDLLLVLCCHGFTHQWERLVWICDVASLVGQGMLNWGDIFQRASRLGVLRIVLGGLALAEDLGTSFPQEVKKRMESDPFVGKFARKISGRVLAAEREEVRAFEWLAIQLSMRERIGDKLRVLFHSIFTPRQYDWTFASVPPSLSFLYYAMRPIRMIRARLTNKSAGA
jgi:hypothetical protein